MEFTPEDVGKCLPPSRPGLIGAQRELRDKAAGFRTIIFVCLGATLFTLFSLKLGGDEDPVRIAANVVTGIGFLGAGAILREGLRVRGLTTAAAHLALRGARDGHRGGITLASLPLPWAWRWSSSGSSQSSRAGWTTSPRAGRTR